MAVDWTKLIPEAPSVEMLEALDEVIHDHFSGKATEITNQGVEAMIEFIRTEIDQSELNAIFRREYEGRQDFYFLVPTPHRGWAHWIGTAAEPIDFCLMVHRQDETQAPIILGACTIKGGRHLDEAEKELFANTLEALPVWRNDPQSWGWIRHEHVAYIPSVWWNAHQKFFDNRAEQRMKERLAAFPPSEEEKIHAVKAAANCSDEAAADFLAYLGALVPLDIVGPRDPLNQDTRDALEDALSNSDIAAPIDIFLSELYSQGFELGEQGLARRCPQ